MSSLGAARAGLQDATFWALWADPGLRDSWFVFVPEARFPTDGLNLSLNPAESFLSICRFAPSRLEGSRRDAFLSEPCAVGFWPLSFSGFPPALLRSRSLSQKRRSGVRPRLRRPSVPGSPPFPEAPLPRAPCSLHGWDSAGGEARRPERQEARGGQAGWLAAPRSSQGSSSHDALGLPPGPEGGREALEHG